MQFYNLWSPINSNFFYHLILMVNNARISLIVVPCIIFENHFSDNIRKKYFVHIFPYYYIQFSYDSLSFLKGSSLPYPIFSISFRISCFLQDLFGIIIVRCFNKGFPVHFFFSFEYFSLPLWDLLKGFPSCHFFFLLLLLYSS